MSIKKIISMYRDYINDHTRLFSERLFLLLTIVSELSLPICFVMDLYTGEDIRELIVLGSVIIYIPVVTTICLYIDKLSFAINTIVIGLEFIVLPVLFICGGGLKGGGVFWIIFAFLYVGLVIYGKWRKFMISALILETLTLYGIEYLFPEMITKHSDREFHIDTLVSLVIVGMLCFLMSWFQNNLFTDENNRAKDAARKAEELNRTQNRFFSSMSHEIRTPINSILGLNELILRDQSASDEVIKDATGIQGAGKMLLALINDILDFSKMEAGSMDIVPVDYKIGDMLSEVVNMIWLKAQDKNLGFNVTVDPNVPSVLFGDEVRVKQVIINLLNNSVKYTKAGSIGLHVECGEQDENSMELILAISDTGMGIKKEALPSLFDAFKRVDEEKNRFIEGTGLGLSIVKQIVELMDGDISVSSVYGEGSTFTVRIRQGITNHEKIGELNIHNQQTVKRTQYEASFRAPEAKLLIVDDNEMNLEVESKLLTDTEMTIDLAVSGKAALEYTVKNQYDVILMDHLMPEMDGIECLDAIRNQAGGLNKNTPIVVLTANAGSENRDLYNRSGFDGYLVKPVSGESLEETLVKYIDKEKLILSAKLVNMREDINTASGYSSKFSVVITSSSMCDLPVSIIKKLRIPIIPFNVITEEGTFKDGVQIGSDELVRYIHSGKSASSQVPSEEEYTEFFANVLKKAHHVIHISLTTAMSSEYAAACEAAKAFENVTVINSEGLSSATGILVLVANKLAQLNIPVEEIVEELNNVKKRLMCSFVIDTTEYMAKSGLVSKRVHTVAKALTLHPCLKVKDDKSTIGGIWLGESKRAYKKYIRNAFPIDVIPDSDVVFITYVDIPEDILLWIKDEIRKYAYFENVIFKQASAGISSNCGPGAFGVLYFVKSNKSYNLGTYFANMYGDETDDEDGFVDSVDVDEKVEVSFVDSADGDIDEEDVQVETKWYNEIEGVDGAAAIANSGSEDSLKTVLKIFYDSIDVKYSEITGFYDAEDWGNYTIKVHALKSSAKLIGAMELADMAQQLENAGKAEDTAFINEHHALFMEDYLKYRDILAKVFGADEAEDKPVADEFLMMSIYEGIRDAAKDMDMDAIEEIMNELSDYTIPDSEKDKYNSVVGMVDNFDYDGIIELLGDE